MLDILSNIMKALGFSSVSIAQTPELALRRAVESYPDLLLIDYNLGYSTGFDLLPDILALAPSEERRPEVVLISAQLSNDVRSEAISLGIEHMLEKPITPMALSGALDRIFQGSR